MSVIFILISVYSLFDIGDSSPLTASEIDRNNRAPPDSHLPPANALPLIISPKYGKILIPGVDIHNGYITDNKDRNIGSYYVPFKRNQTRGSVQATSLNSKLVNMGVESLDKKTQKSSQIQLNADRIRCKLHTPFPDCKIRNAESMYGKWFVQTEPGIEKGSPICEKVEFFPGSTQHDFKKVLETYILNETWVTQQQNGTIVSPGKIMLEMETVNGIPVNPRRIATYTLIDGDPDNYITAYYCRKGQPSIPVLTRAEVPSMEVWGRVFAGVIKAGLELSWMNLNCRPPVINPEPNPNTYALPVELPLKSTADSIFF